MAVAVLVAASVVLAIVLLGGGDKAYTVTARFQNASQLVKGNLVQVAGVPVGEIKGIDLASDGMAEVKLEITEEGYTPLRRGTQAIIRLTSLSGVANRYVDLQMPPGNPGTIPEGGVLQTTNTTSAVDLDQVLSTFDREARQDLQGVVQGFGRQFQGKSAEARRGYLYLNPSLAASSRLFEELNRDDGTLARFVMANDRLMTDLTERRDDVAGLVDELANFTGALAREKGNLADAIDRLPPFMRRANTTFVNLRGTIDDLRPLVEESKPVAKKLRPLFRELRPFARDARPTLRDLSRLVRTPGEANDLVELTRSNLPVRDIAVRDVQRNGRERRGAFPETVRALRGATPQLSFARPYAVDLTGWFDDFGHSGVYDALGGVSRVGTYVNAFGIIDGALRPIPPALRPQVAQESPGLVTNQRNRCPGAAERPADDGSNPWKPTPDHNCDPSQRLPGR